MSKDPEKPTISERYVAATNSRDLTLNPIKRTDADILLAAGYAASGNTAGTLALRFYRLKATGDRSDFRELVDLTGEWLRSRSNYKGRRQLSRVQANEVAARTMLWWIDNTCRVCDGHGHPKIPDAPTINYGHDCGFCHGTRKIPVNRVVPHGMSDEALWLENEIDKQCAFIFSDMAKLLAPKLNLEV